MKKLKEILLIDDSKGANNLNKMLLFQMGVAENVTTALNGRLALDYLTTKDIDGNYPCPEVIFLDINMPVMDGYQFLDAYAKPKGNIQSNQIIVMLTTSINEVDIEKAQQYPHVKGYQFKPLTKEKVYEILDQTF